MNTSGTSQHHFVAELTVAELRKDRLILCDVIVHPQRSICGKRLAIFRRDGVRLTGDWPQRGVLARDGNAIGNAVARKAVACKIV